MKIKKQYWFRFTKKGYGLCMTHKSVAPFSIRHGLNKSLCILGYYVYIIKPYY